MLRLRIDNLLSVMTAVVTAVAMAVGLSACTSNDDDTVDSYLKRLDSLLDDGDKYINRRIAAIDSIVVNVELSSQRESDLADLALPINIDQAQWHIKRAIILAREEGDAEALAKARLRQASIYNAQALMVNEAIGIFNDVDTDTLSTEAKVARMTLGVQIYRNLAEQSIDSTLKERYTAIKQSYRDSVLALSGDNEIIAANKLTDKGLYSQAAELLNIKQAIDTFEIRRAPVYHVLAGIEKLEGNNKLRKLFLAKAAVCDISNGVREHMALHELALMLYDEGDIERAWRYIHRSIDDAKRCNAKVRMLELSKSLPMIEVALNAENRQARNNLRWAIAIIVVLSVVTVLTIRRKNRRLKSTANALAQLNNDLSVANAKETALNANLRSESRIKNQYIMGFMNLGREYLAKMESYRAELDKLATAREYERLTRAIKSSRYVNGEITEFYRKFDEAFLQLFPGFTDGVNSLLRADQKIETKEQGELTTELRIYALLRLGIKESGEIARFLRCSDSTVYNYRTKMRNKAINRETFEADVMAIKG